HALDPVLVIIAVRRQQLRDCVDAGRTTAAEGAGGVIHRLADLESVFHYRVLINVRNDIVFRQIRPGPWVVVTGSLWTLPRNEARGNFDGRGWRAGGGR